MAKKEKPLKEIIKENQRMIIKSIRDLEKEIRALEASEKKLANDIRKSAKANQVGNAHYFTVIHILIMVVSVF